MTIKWTPENGQRLLYIIANKYQLKGSELIKAWEEAYGTEGKDFSKPNARAPDDHLWKIKSGKIGPKAKSLKGTPQRPTLLAKPASASKPTISQPRTPKTSMSGEKRKRNKDSEDEMSSDADESEVDMSKAALSSLGRRKSTPRSRITPINYNEDSDHKENEADTEGVAEAVLGGQKFAVENGEIVAKGPVADNGGHSMDVDDLINFDGAGRGVSKRRGSIGSSKKREKVMEDGNESDISTFSADFK